MRSLAKANGLSVMGELMEPPKLLKLAELSGFKAQTSLVDVAKSGKDYDQCLIGTLDSGYMALLIYDINPANGGPGSNGGTKAHWCVVFGYYTEKGKTAGAGTNHVLVVHGWGKFFDWGMDDLMKSVAQMKVHPGWDLRMPATKTVTPTQSFKASAAPSGKPAYKKDGVVVIPPLQKDQLQVNVPGTDYANWNKQYIEFG
jgi:hypothetical protein